MMRQKRYNGRSLVLAMVLTAALAVAGWEMVRSSNTKAYAAEPMRVLDAGVQRRQMVEQQKVTNQKLGELITLLKSGKLKVQIAEEKSKKKGSK